MQGIENRGSTCAINSLIQIITRNDILRNIILNNVITCFSIDSLILTDNKCFVAENKLFFRI